MWKKLILWRYIFYSNITLVLRMWLWVRFCALNLLCYSDGLPLIDFLILSLCHERRSASYSYLTDNHGEGTDTKVKKWMQDYIPFFCHKGQIYQTTSTLCCRTKLRHHCLPQSLTVHRITLQVHKVCWGKPSLVMKYLKGQWKTHKGSPSVHHLDYMMQ